MRLKKECYLERSVEKRSDLVSNCRHKKQFCISNISRVKKSDAYVTRPPHSGTTPPIAYEINGTDRLDFSL